MNALTVVSTDLITPLGAYLRLRESGRASFLLESVEKGRLGRHSFIGAGSRLVDFAEAERCGLPVVGYLGYDHAARLEPTVPLPDDGRGRPARRFVVPHPPAPEAGAGVRRSRSAPPAALAGCARALGVAKVLSVEPRAVADLLAGPQP